MCPRGDESPEAVREIGRMYIANVGGTSIRGDYEVAVCRRGSQAVPKPIDPDGPKSTREGKVFGYPRLAYNVWRLIARALLVSFPEERVGRDRQYEADTSISVEPTDEQAAELGLELLGDVHFNGETIIRTGREAWLRGARPRGF